MGRLKESRQTKVDRFTTKYGQSFLDDLSRLKTNPAYTLQKVGTKYNITRERIRQIYRMFFKEAYTVSRDLKSKKIHDDNKIGSCDPRNRACKDFSKPTGVGTIGEIAVINKATELGFDVKPACGGRDININGFYVEVKTATSSRQYHPKSSTKSYKFKISSGQEKNNSFFVFVAKQNEEERFFIVPAAQINGSHSIYITEKPSASKTNKRKFYEYENAWHLLLPIADSSKFLKYVKSTLAATLA